jgi:curved DNA-binding protein CbpA
MRNQPQKKSPSDIPEFYSRLGVSRDANQDDLNKAMVTLSARYNPNIFSDSQKAAKEYAKEQYASLQEAYLVLSKPEFRKKYDALLDKMVSTTVVGTKKNQERTSTYKASTLDEDLEQEEREGLVPRLTNGAKSIVGKVRDAAALMGLGQRVKAAGKGVKRKIEEGLGIGDDAEFETPDHGERYVPAKRTKQRPDNELSSLLRERLNNELGAVKECLRRSSEQTELGQAFEGFFERNMQEVNQSMQGRMRELESNIYKQAIFCVKTGIQKQFKDDYVEISVMENIDPDIKGIKIAWIYSSKDGKPRPALKGTVDQVVNEIVNRVMDIKLSKEEKEN